MKKYKVKINCPDFKVGQIVNSHPYCYCTQISCANYPDIFEEIKQPLFTTFDGVEIFDLNTKLYEVSVIRYQHNGTIELCQYPNDAIKLFDKSMYLHFSTEKAAENWINENKPVFSRKQLKDAIDNSTSVTNNYVSVKEKLKKELGL